MKCSEIKQRYDFLKSQRKTVENTWQFIEQFVVPFRGEFFKDEQSEHEIDWRKREIFDSTAIIDAQVLSASMQGALISPATNWFELRFDNEDLNMDDEAKEWIDECKNIVFAALHESNFDLEASEFLLDLVSFGTAGISEEIDEAADGSWNGLKFQAMAVREFYFEQDHNSQIHRLYKGIWWTPAQIMSKFGDDTPEDIVEKADSPQFMDTKIEIIFCVYPRKGKENADVAKPIPPKERPFGYKYVIHKVAEPIGDEGGYYEMPAFVSRWRKTSHSMWGHSPATVALSDILTLNELTEATLEALGKVVDPATLTTERGLLSDLDLGRGGLTVVRSLEDIKPYESRARFDVGELKIERLQMSIHRAFYIDQLQMKDSPAMTATEVNVRYEQMQRLLGPVLGRLQNDFLDPLITRTFNILARAGQLPDIPDVVREAAGGYNVEYTGPLPRSQRMDSVITTQQWMAQIAQLGEIFPTMIDIIDTDKIARGTGLMSGVPAKFMRSDEEIKGIRNARAEMQEKQMQAQMMQEEGKGMQEIGKGQKELNDAGQAS